MAGLLTREGFNFLYRSEEGTVDRKTWWLGVIMLDAVLFVLVMIWLVVRPWANRSLSERAMLDGYTLAAYVYVMFFSFAALLIAASYVNLTAKRFRTRGFNRLPAGLAGIPWVLALLVGAAYWLHHHVPDAVAVWWIWAAGIACAGAMIWHVVELGLRPDAVASPR